MSFAVPYRHLWSPERLTSDDLAVLLNTAAMLKHARRPDSTWDPLRGRHVALLCSGSGKVAPAFQHAIGELGGTVSLLNADEWRVRAGDRIPAASRLLGRLYDAVDCCDLPTAVVEQIEAHSAVAVFNGLANPDHPMALLGEFLTMHEAKPLHLSRLDLTEHELPGSVRPALALARLAGMQIVQRHATMPVSGKTEAAAGDEPDFILDTTASSGKRLTQPHASAAQEAELDGRLVTNRHCTLQAAIVCGLQ